MLSSKPGESGGSCSAVSGGVSFNPVSLLPPKGRMIIVMTIMLNHYFLLFVFLLRFKITTKSSSTTSTIKTRTVVPPIPTTIPTIAPVDNPLVAE